VTERELRRLLREAPLPEAEDARGRAWDVVRSAYEDREPVAWPRRHRRPILATAVALVILAGALSPPGRAVLGSLRDAIGREKVVGRKPTAPALVSLPAPGRLLVNSSRGPWVVHRDGTKRRLGPYGVASWSPHGLFAVSARGHELFALDPDKTGSVRWSLARRQPVHGAQWSPEGYRIAYLAGSNLHVVAGDSTGDHVFADAVAPSVAWRPDAQHVLALAGRPDGRVYVYRADSNTQLWRSAPGDVPTQVAWSSDGAWLAALAPDSLRIYGRTGRLLREVPAGGRPFVNLAFAPRGHAFALVRRRPGGRSVVQLMRGSGLRNVLPLAGRIGEVAWSPDGRWLLVTWPSADQFLFVRSANVEHILAFSDIARQFGGGRFPTLGGWCCAR
jgi:WD40 repeat protein